MSHYIGIAGTNAKHSTNKQLLQYMVAHFSQQATIELANIDGLPMFYKTPDHQIPRQASTLAEKIAATDGVIISTPEYDHAIPAVLASALAWLSYHVHPFAGKPVMIVGASHGILGTSRAQAQLRQILDSPELKASVMPGSEFMIGHSLSAFDENGNLRNQHLVKRLDDLFLDFGVFVDISKQLTRSQQQAKEQAEAVDWVTTGGNDS